MKYIIGSSFTLVLFRGVTLLMLNINCLRELDFHYIH